MNKFIRLSECVGENKTFAIIQNADMIIKMTVANRGRDTHILFKDGTFIFVKESLDQIWAMLNADYNYEYEVGVSAMRKSATP